MVVPSARGNKGVTLMLKEKADTMRKKKGIQLCTPLPYSVRGVDGRPIALGHVTVNRKILEHSIKEWIQY